jgi:hypothetical protein
MPGSGLANGRATPLLDLAVLAAWFVTAVCQFSDCLNDYAGLAFHQ